MFTLILATSPFFLKSCFAQDNSIGFVVVLDAGHGGHDSGNTGNGYLEKKIALSMNLLFLDLKALLSEFLPQNF